MSVYPELAPYRTGRLRVSALHELHFSESGRPDGKPVLCLHGGPGAGSDAGERRFFDPAAYRIIQLDQRGCGQSTPHGSLESNTTWDLVADLESLREHLGIGRWQLFGGSWGSTLALAYAETHPARVTELVLRGVFLLRQEELDWFYCRGAHHVFPDRWADFVADIPDQERGDLLRAYRTRLTADDPDTRRVAALAWARWEASTCTLLPDEHVIEALSDEATALALARIENHYFVHGAWLGDRPLLANVAAIRAIPGVIVQGRYDVVCPLRSAFDLHRAWPRSTLHVIEGAGHAAHEPGIARALCAATDRFRPG